MLVETDDSLGAEGGKIAMSYIIEDIVGVEGFRLCHSSILSFMNRPGMLRGQKEPFGSTTFPLVFFLHFPSAMYCWQMRQLLMKCPSRPQNTQRTSSVCACAIWGASAFVRFGASAWMSVVANLSRKVVRSSVLIIGLALEEEGVVDGAEDSLNSTEEPVVP